MLLVTVLLIIATIPCLAQQTEPDVQGAPALRVENILIDVYDYPGRKNQIITMARDLISLKVGGPFSQALLESSISLLKLSGRFEEVGAETKEQPGGVAVSFRLKPYLLIREIRISGEYPLFQQDILNAMTTHVGDYLLPDLSVKQESLILQYLLSEGFIEPKVRVEAVRDSSDATAILDVRLDKGAYYKLKSLTIEGNRHVSETRIKARMSTWIRSFFLDSSGRFRGVQLGEDIKDLASFYWSRGFADAAITDSVKKDPKSGDVDVLIRVQEGPRYEVSIEGNEKFFDFILKRQVLIFREGNRRGSGLRRSAGNIREYYRTRGFPDVSVSTVEEKAVSGDQEIRKVTFVIDEGNRVNVESVSFKGNAAFDDHELLSRMQIWKKTIPVIGGRLFVSDVLDQDIRTIKALYRKKGFGSVSVKTDLAWVDDRKSITVGLTITEGPQTIVSSVSFEGLTSVTKEQALSCIGLKAGEPFDESALRDGENSLGACISEQGYPHVTVKGTARLSPDRTRADVRFAVREGQLVRMGRTYFSGDFKTRRRVLVRELNMEPGDPFSLRKMVEGQNAIRDMNIFNSVQFKTLGLKENREEVTVLADLEEKKPYYLQSSLGYQSNVGTFGSARAGDHNFLGLNRDVYVSAEASQVNRRYDLGVNAPRLFGSRFSGIYNLYSERREDFNQYFGLNTLGSTLGIFRKIGKPVFASLTFKYERRNEFLLDTLPQDTDPSVLDPRSSIVVTPAITYDTRDSFMRPRKGTLSSLTVDVSNGLQNSLDNFVRYRLDARAYVSPFERLTFAWLGRVGYVDPTRNVETIADDQLFYLGGTLDVRGYDENMLLYAINPADGTITSVGGRLSIVNSIEARITLIDGLELALFFDTGMLRMTNVDPAVPHTRSSYGTGLRYVTPIGPISLLYGHKLSPEPEESPYKLHFSVGYTF